MKYAYFLDVQGVDDKRNNSKVFQLISELDIPEENVFSDEKESDRTEFNDLVDRLQSEDVLIIRSAKDIASDIDELLEVLYELHKREIELFSCEEPYLCGDAFYLTINDFMVFLNYFYVKKQKSGYQKAVDEGRVGRPAKTDDVEKAIKLYETGTYTISQIVQLTGVSKSTLYKYLKE